MIGIISFGAGNLTSVQQAFEHLGAPVTVIHRAKDLHAIHKLVLPGVGHFQAIGAMNKRLRAEVLNAVRRGMPLLGICLGMQWLFEGSEEAPGIAGAGLFPGQCRALPACVKSLHVGWNSLEVQKNTRLLYGIGPQPFVYFTHSFVAPECPYTSAVADYGGQFTAAVESGTVYGVQFHPEKSGATGLAILKNFCEL